MALNIKNEEVSRAANELARLTGESITDAVGHAIAARLAEVRRMQKREKVAEQLRAIGRKCANQAPAEWLRRDFDQELYDDRGLPK